MKSLKLKLMLYNYAKALISSYNLPGNVAFEKMAKTVMQDMSFSHKSVEDAVKSFYHEANSIIEIKITQ